MQLPVGPPRFEPLMEATLAQGSALTARVFGVSSEVDEHGRYLHWDKLRHLPPPKGLSAEQWWLGIKLARRKNFRGSFRDTHVSSLIKCRLLNGEQLSGRP